MLEVPTPSTASPREAGARLLDAVPDMNLGVPSEERAEARRAIVAPLHELPAGRIDRSLADSPAYPFAFIILGGLILRNTRVRERAATEVFAAGDVIDPRPDSEPLSLPVTAEYVVHRPATVVVLDDRFRRAARRWPSLHDVVHAQLARQRRRASTHLAILQLPRVEDRLTALFTEFADRWGRVTTDGVAIDVPLTHEVLGRLVSSRRPTVTLALAELAATGALTRSADGTWLLSHAALAAQPA